MKTSNTILFFLLSILSLKLFAHGEDKPGPHGGYIRMPGAFHTEVVKKKDGYRIYLLDINWKNPSVLDSSIEASIENDKKLTQLTCKKETDSYLCKSKLRQKGNLKIKATREGQVGEIAIYKLPLKFEIPENEMPAHDNSNHKAPENENNEHKGH